MKISSLLSKEILKALLEIHVNSSRKKCSYLNNTDHVTSQSLDSI